MFKYMQVKQRILLDVEKLKPHEKIMSRPMMCKKFGFARTTVDAAINELIEEKILYSIVGSGTYVSDQRVVKQIDNPDVSSWGIVLPNLVEDIFPQFVRGIEDYSQTINTNTVICNTDNSISKQDEYFRRLVDSGVSGLIVVPAISREQGEGGFEIVRKAGLPIVFCSRTVSSFIDAPLVYSNDFYGGYIATKHLLRAGYRRIAYIARELYQSSRERYAGYFAALAEENIEINRSFIYLEPLRRSDGDNYYSNDDSYYFMQKLLELPDHPDAFFCFNDRVGAQAYRAVRQAGFAVSDDIGVVSYDDTGICDVIEPKLSSVNFGGFEMGNKAAAILHKSIEGGHLEGTNVYVIQPKLTVRDSCLGPK
ncbi:MAG: GntR family transcriptional regulator [Clostridiales bacterium]|jgi:DNA-binding LacI/PurR family transcriptional regulator|nr:GntR family transcriptional regulator [Clostridiales bacterium]